MTERRRSSGTVGEKSESLIDNYRPFIADVPGASYAEPFPVEIDDGMTDEEVARRRNMLRSKIDKKNFSPPLSLSDFCLIAQERWDREDRGGDGCTAGCKVV